MLRSVMPKSAQGRLLEQDLVQCGRGPAPGATIDARPRRRFSEQPATRKKPSVRDLFFGREMRGAVQALSAPKAANKKAEIRALDEGRRDKATGPDIERGLEDLGRYEQPAREPLEQDERIVEGAEQAGSERGLVAASRGDPLRDQHRMDHHDEREHGI